MVRSRGCTPVRRGRWRAARVEEVEGISGEEEVDKWPEPGAGVTAHLAGDEERRRVDNLIPSVNLAV
jgi:hypothetical protein